MARPHHNALTAGYEIHWYVIDSLLGKGGFGITYLATDTNLDQKVAIKEFLPAELATRSGDSTVHPLTEDHTDTYGWGLNRFLHEARTLAKFRHPSIVRVLSVFEANNTAYMVMEYEEGQSLEDAYKFKKIGGETALRDILLPLLDGLDKVHESGFIHRDIKPDNIYLREDGSPVLLDFGSARQAIGAETRTLTALVSPGYAPFEQYDSSKEGDKKQGPWTDIYSLGATLYRGVTGFGPPDAMQRVNAVVGGNDIYKPAVDISPEGFSREFLVGIDAALEFLPEKRPQTIAAWRDMFTAGETQPATGISADAATQIRQPVKPSATERATTQKRGRTKTPKTAPSETAASTPPQSPPRQDDASKSGWIMPAVAVVAGVAIVGAGLYFGGFIPTGTDVPQVAETAQVAAVPEETLSPEEAARRRAEEARKRAEEFARQAEEARKRAEAESQRVLTLEAQRELREKIDGLLEAAAADVEAGQMTSPENNNAFAKYQEVLKLDADNADAKAGLNRIVDTLVAWADLSMSKKNFDAAVQRLDQAAGVMPGSATVDSGRKRLVSAKAAHEAEQRRLAEEKIRKAEEAKQLAEAEQLRKEAEAKRLAEEKAAKALVDKINGLLARADKDLQAGNLVAPEKQNALARFRAVLALDPENAKARDGVARVASTLVSQADAAIEENEFDQAKALLSQADAITPGAAKVKTAQEQLASSRTAYVAEQKRIAEEAERQAQIEREKAEAEAKRVAEEKAERDRIKKIKTLLTQADADLAATRLTSPAGKNAFERYRAVLELDPENAEAKAGLESIVTRYLELKDRALGNQDLDKADEYLAKAETVLPNSEQIALAREELSAAIEARDAEREAQREAEAAQAEAERARKENEALAKAQAELEKLKAEQAKLKAALSQQQAARSASTAGATRTTPSAGQKIKIAVMPIGRGNKANSIEGGDHDSEVAQRIDDVLRKASSFQVSYKGHRPRNTGGSISNNPANYWQGVSTQKPRLTQVASALSKVGADYALMVAYDVSFQGFSTNIWNPATDVYLVDRSGKQIAHHQEQDFDFGYLNALLTNALAKLDKAGVAKATVASAPAVSDSSARSAAPGKGQKIKVAVMPIGRGNIANVTSGGDRNDEIIKRVDRLFKKRQDLEVVYHGYRREPLETSVSSDAEDYWKGVSTLEPKPSQVLSALNTLGADFALMIAYDVSQSGTWTDVWKPTTDIYVFNKSGKQVLHLQEQGPDFRYLDKLVESALGKLQSVNLATSVTSPAKSQSRTSAQGSGGPLKVAFLPLGRDHNALGSSAQPEHDEAIIKSLHKFVRQKSQLELSYSSYNEDLASKAIDSREDSLWEGGFTDKKPNAEIVYQIGQQLGVDVVVMVFYGIQYNGWVNNVWHPETDVYFFDVKNKKQFHKRRKESYIDYIGELIESVYTDFKAG